MRKLLLVSLALTICACKPQAQTNATNEEKAKAAYVQAIAKELSAEVYNYTFTKLEPQDEEIDYICDFYTWDPTTSYSKWVCGGYKEGIIDCDLLILQHLN